MFHFLRTVSIPVLCETAPDAYADGTLYAVYIENGFGNGVTLSWGEHPPEAWQSFIERILEFLKTLRTCDVEALTV